MLWKKDTLFCDMNPLFFAISTQKEILRRRIRDRRSGEVFARTLSQERLPNRVSGHSSHLLKHGPGIDPVLQENKAVNIRLACEKLDGLILHPGETFSFWRAVGKTSEKKGYRDGRVIEHGTLVPGTGGGLCNLGNTIHLLVLHSPLTVTEFHHHSDALAPDPGVRIPMSAGTSVCYNYIDYRCKNNTDQDMQLRLRVEGDSLIGELRSQKPIPWRYALVEEDHHFQKEGERYYRVSKIYREQYDRESGALLEKKLILDNHSEVMFDPSLIPPELLREPVTV